jgi:hypothetical protein
VLIRLTANGENPSLFDCGFSAQVTYGRSDSRYLCGEMPRWHHCLSMQTGVAACQRSRLALSAHCLFLSRQNATATFITLFHGVERRRELGSSSFATTAFAPPPHTHTHTESVAIDSLSYEYAQLHGNARLPTHAARAFIAALEWSCSRLRSP